MLSISRSIRVTFTLLRLVQESFLGSFNFIMKSWIRDDKKVNSYLKRAFKVEVPYPIMDQLVQGEESCGHLKVLRLSSAKSEVPGLD